MSDVRHDLLRVTVAGGGVAALETVLALHSIAGHSVDVTVLASSPRFLYRPVTVAEAFERGEARSWPLADLLKERLGATVVNDTITGVRAKDRVAVCASGVEQPYDRLVVAVGAVTTDPLPGALTFRGRDDVPTLRQILDELVAGEVTSVAFVLPSGRTWPLPLYELALMTAAHVRDHGVSRASIMLITPEGEPLELFGPETAAVLAPLLHARGVELRRSSLATNVNGRMVTLAGGGHLYADRVVTLPHLQGPRLSGLPMDSQGFIPVDTHGRVQGTPNVFAAGDVTTFPLKQGGLATQQADAVAEWIASEVGAAVRPAPFSPVLRGLLLTGGAPLYLRSEPQRLAHSSTVAIDTALTRRPARHSSIAGGQALWWPPAKIAGRYLGPFLATARPDLLHAETLADRVPVAGAPVSDAEQEDAFELALLLADCDAQWGDYRSALDALDAAQALRGMLPPEFEAKRRAWSAAHQLGE